MSLPIRLLPEATDDLSAAVEWYKKTKTIGLGERFVVAVRDAIRRVATHPTMHGTVYQDVRKSRVIGFPYIVLYREDQGELVVISVFHTSRDPAEWQIRA